MDFASSTIATIAIVYRLSNSDYKCRNLAIDMRVVKTASVRMWSSLIATTILNYMVKITPLSGVNPESPS